MRSDGQTSQPQRSTIARILATTRAYFGLEPAAARPSAAPSTAPSFVRVDSLERFGDLSRGSGPDSPDDLLARVEEY